MLGINLNEANESPRDDTGAMGSTIVVPEEVFVAWQRMCNHVMDRVREVERLFYEAGR